MPGPNQYYVDPAIAANSGTGTLGDPFGDLQYCLNTITRSTTVGDQINIKAGTAEVMSASISLATYGTPTKLILAGYTAAADDGGIGEITFGGTNADVFSATSNIDLRCLKIGNFGTGFLRTTGTVSLCEIYNFTGSIVTSSSNGFIHNHVHTHSGTNLCVQVNATFCFQNLIRSSTNWVVLYGNGSGLSAVENVVVHSNATGNALEAFTIGSNFSIIGNSVINTAAGTGRGIAWNCTTVPNSGIIANNIVQGWNGTGGRAFGPNGGTRPCFMLRSNRWFNCATGVAGTAGADYMAASDNSVLSATPFTDVANLDFRVSSEVASLGWPTSLRSAPLSTQFKDLGALQRVAGSSSGSLINSQQLVRAGWIQ